MSDNEHLPTQNRRRFTRVALDIPTEMHQGGVVWQVQLIDVSLNGIAVVQPENWDADYSHPFGFILQLADASRFEVYAHLMHVEADTLGFQLEHLGAEQIAPLARLLAQKLDASLIEQELQRLALVND
jgi:hypothetical protein